MPKHRGWITLLTLALLPIAAPGCAAGRPAPRQPPPPPPPNELTMQIEFPPQHPRGWSDTADFIVVLHNGTREPILLCPLANDITLFPYISQRDPLPELQSTIEYGSDRMPGFFAPDKDEPVVLQPGESHKERVQSNLFRWLYYSSSADQELGKGQWLFRVLYKPARLGSAIFPETEATNAKPWLKPVISPLYRVQFDLPPADPHASQSLRFVPQPMIAATRPFPKFEQRPPNGILQRPREDLIDDRPPPE